MLGNDMPRDGYYPPSTVHDLNSRITKLERQLAEARKDLELLSQPEAIRHEMLKEAMKDTERLEGFIDRIQAMTRHQSAHFICERINDFKEQKGQDDE